MTPYIATERDCKETTVLVGHLHQFCKKGNLVGLLCRIKCILVKPPELLSEVPAEEIGETPEHILKRLQVVALQVGMSAGCRLASEPQSVLLAHRSP